MNRARYAPLAALVVIGAAWGLTQPLIKISVGTGYRQLGLIFWQLAVAAMALALFCLFTRRGLPLTRPGFIRYAVVAIAGAIIPGLASYGAARELPAGVLAILLSTTPILTFPMALMLGGDRFTTRRLAGLLLGLSGVVLIALPGSALPSAAMIPFVALALFAPLSYAVEGNYVAQAGLAGLGPVQVQLGASLLGAALVLPLALATGQFIVPPLPFGDAEWALLGVGLIDAAVYSGYVWLVGFSGAVFAVQVSYLVSGFGVFWSMLILGERYAPGLWALAALIVAGMALVQPRRSAPLAGHLEHGVDGGDDHGGSV